MASETPDWAKSGGAPAPAPAPAAAPAGAAPAAPQKKGVKDWSTSKVLNVMRLVNVLNGLGIVASTVLQLLGGLISIDFQTILLSAYAGIFGMLLMCAEMHFSAMDKWIRTRFGFMFSFVGRALFILFSASIMFATATWVGYLVGGLTLCNAIFNCWVIYMHPGFGKEGIGMFDDPYKGYSGGEKEMAAYLQKHPELAQKAVNAGVSVAQNNPALGAQAMSMAASAATQPRQNDNPFDV